MMKKNAKKIVFKKEDGALLAGLLIRVKELATLISKKRYYVGEDMTFDPRYLLFEFTWNITLRDRQVEIVQEFYGAIKNGESLVRQVNFKTFFFLVEWLKYIF